MYMRLGGSLPITWVLLVLVLGGCDPVGDDPYVVNWGDDTDSDTTDTSSDTSWGPGDSDSMDDTESGTAPDTDTLTLIPVEWVVQATGSYERGSALEADEQPIHTVTIHSAFEMTRSEITVDQYRQCVMAGACTVPSTEGDCTLGAYGNWAVAYNRYPVNCVSWVQADEYCDWIDGRLPTEAEWQWAAGGDRLYAWGDEDPSCALAVIQISASEIGCGSDRAFPVCMKPAGHSWYGDLCDMTGNVYEWVADTYQDSYTNAPTDGSIWDVAGNDSHVIRGGAYYGSDNSLRLNKRASAPEDTQYDHLGFRCAR